MTTAENVHVKYASMGGYPMDERAIEATLAIAYEQRTANLIALWSNPEATLMDLKTGRQRTTGLGTDIMDKVLEQIMERLGLQ